MGGAIRARILVLDDDALVRRAMERAAGARSDVALEAVGTPGEVLERIDAGEQYDLIVCDYRLKIEGRTTTSAQLLRDLAGRGLRVAVMTGDVTSIAPDLGYIPALEKPLRLDDILVHASPKD